ncbi:MAG: hypothetical protein FWD31_09665 [Planctomycetaceae bacterium]|nr:hypothetical protein [Planctomycetaceae bacterium]
MLTPNENHFPEDNKPSMVSLDNSVNNPIHFKDVDKNARVDNSKERWYMAKQIIEGERGLINQRTNRFLTLQGFLFTAVVAVIGAYFYSGFQTPTLAPIVAVLKTLLFASLVIVVTFTIYRVAWNSAARLIDATTLAKKQAYYASSLSCVAAPVTP